MDEVQEQFDDPGLRDVIRRAVGKPAAPAHLRDKVAALMTTVVPVPAPQPSRWRMRGLDMPQFTWRAAALAAMFLMAIGLAGYQVYSYMDDFIPPRASAPHPVAFPATFAANIVAAHDACARQRDHHLIPGNDVSTIRAQLSQQEGLSVFASSLNGGWTFKGAGVCKVGDAKAAHLLFARGDEMLSVFTLPGDGAGSCGEATTFEQIENHDAITGFRRGAAMYVVVVSNASHRDVPLAEAQSVLQTVQCEAPPMPADATAPKPTTGSGT